LEGFLNAMELYFIKFNNFKKFEIFKKYIKYDGLPIGGACYFVFFQSWISELRMLRASKMHAKQRKVDGEDIPKKCK
jgi:hypothetical protein